MFLKRIKRIETSLGSWEGSARLIPHSGDQPVGIELPAENLKQLGVLLDPSCGVAPSQNRVRSSPIQRRRGARRSECQIGA